MPLRDGYGSLDRRQKSGDDSRLLIHLQEVLGLDCLGIAVAERWTDPFPSPRPIIPAALLGISDHASMSAFGFAQCQRALIAIANTALGEERSIKLLRWPEA